MTKALIVVDVQKFFLYAAPDDLVAKIVRHIRKHDYDAIAFTVFKNNLESNFVKSLNWTKCSRDEDTILPREFDPYINAQNVVSRSTYSAFSGTNLDQYLRERNIDTVVLCGVDTDACVLATAFSAFDLGYKIRVDFAITYSNGELEDEARAILERSLTARR
jgi:nicotinamidase-related amidase